MLESVLGIKNFFFIQRIAFGYLGIDVTSVEWKIRRQYIFCIALACNIIILLAMSKYSWENRDDMNKFLSGLATILQIFICFIKFLITIKRRKEVAKLLHNIWILTIEANTEELPIIAEENAKDYMFSLCFYISSLASGVLVLVIPIFITLYVYVNTEELLLFHILPTSYPFDQYQPTNYFITYCFLVGCVYLNTQAVVLIDTIYSWLILNTAAQFRVLKLKLRKVALNHQDCEMDYALIRCIRRHQKIISIADEINNLFRMIIFAEVLKDCMVFSLIAYQLGHWDGAKLEYIPFLIVFLICAAAQLTIYCYGGQRIQEESQHISDFIYENFSWHSIKIRDQKSLMIIIARAQKYCQLSGYFFTVNWKLFLWAARTNFSYISLLWSLSVKKL